MQVQSRRQTLAQMAAAFGALMLSASVLRRILPRGTASRVSRGLKAPARRVQPAPHSVKRHG